MMHFPEKELLEAELQRYADTIQHETLRNATEHLLMAGGKRLRPQMVVLAYKAAGGQEPREAIPAAAAIELLHNWSLVHDDIIDKSPLRRGVPTVHTKWDEHTALLAGDALQNLAYEAMADQKAADTRELSWVASQLLDGQMRDISFDTRRDITEDEYMDMVQRKTGALIQQAMRIGALVGTGSQQIVDALSAYGRGIGMAFQLRDDLIDISADASSGKEFAKDIGEGKRTLLVIHALHNSERDERLLTILDKPENTQQEIDEAIDILSSCQALEHAHNIMQSLVSEAKEQLSALPASEAKDALDAIADYCITRKR